MKWEPGSRRILFIQKAEGGAYEVFFNCVANDHAPALCQINFEQSSEKIQVARLRGAVFRGTGFLGAGSWGSNNLYKRRKNNPNSRESRLKLGPDIQGRFMGSELESNPELNRHDFLLGMILKDRTILAICACDVMYVD